MPTRIRFDLILTLAHQFWCVGHNQEALEAVKAPACPVSAPEPRSVNSETSSQRDSNQSGDEGDGDSSACVWEWGFEK